MKHYFPKYCEKFRCIANLCPDSCCRDWDVVVDDTSFDFYNTAKGEFGDRLRSLMTIDEDGDRIFIRQGEKCPFWNSDMLCDIYINIGENHLCHTCKEFPRITQDYTVFCEHTLSFACPEAARLMLESDFDTGFATDIPQDSQTDYSTTEMNFLLSARKRTFEILSDCKMSLPERLCRLLAFNERVQNMLDDEIFDITAMPAALANGKLVVAIMSEGHFTSSGHFIVLRGVKDGKIMVADPASYTRSEQLWDLSIILNEASRRAGAGGPFWIIG